MRAVPFCWGDLVRGTLSPGRFVSKVPAWLSVKAFLFSRAFSWRLLSFWCLELLLCHLFPINWVLTASAAPVVSNLCVFILTVPFCKSLWIF